MTKQGIVEILLVEDNLSDAELAIRSLKKSKLANKIIHVKNGKEALDFVAARNEYSSRNVGNIPSVILLDLKLPKVNGLEVLKVLKADERTKSIPVVVLTSSEQEKDIVESYKLGVNSYIVKPVDFDKFSEAVIEIGHYWVLLNQKLSV
ncbi:MAG: response regulator, partial [Ignavibacteria bacterium]|nr:response regulator [Ignavibacteria bacterium]